MQGQNVALFEEGVLGVNELGAEGPRRRVGDYVVGLKDGKKRRRERKREEEKMK